MSYKEINIESPRSTRTNRYYEAPVKWDTYPKGIVLACRGSRYRYDTSTHLKCGSVKDFYMSLDKKDFKPFLNRCDRLDCYEDGMFASDKRAKDASMRILGGIRCSDEIKLKFFSFNIRMAQDARRLRNESYEKFILRKKNLIKFNMVPGEDFENYIKRVQKIVSKQARNAGLKGFAMITHACRLKNVSGIEMRVWSLHFHLIGYGYLLDGKDFIQKYGYNYTPQKFIDITKYSEVMELQKRISYRINHCAFFRYKSSGKACHSVKYFGDMSYNKLKIPEQVKNFESILNDSGYEFVKVDINRDKIKSKTSSGVKKFLSIFSAKIEKFKHDGFYVYNHLDFDNGNPDNDGLIYDYYPEKWDRAIEYAKKLIFNDDLIFENLQEEDVTIKLDKNGQQIKLVHVEVLRKYYNKQNNKISVVSSNEFVLMRVPHFELLDESYKNLVDLDSLKRVWENFIKKINERDKDGGIKYIDKYLEVI